MIPDLADALAAVGFGASWAGVEPRVVRDVVLGFSETRLGLCARELARSLATSRAEGLEFVLLGADLEAEGAAVTLDLLGTLRAEPTEEGFFLTVPEESDFCERLSELADLDSAGTASGFVGGVSRVFGAVSVRVAGSSLGS
jgi:hypothetical protein